MSLIRAFFGAPEATDMANVIRNRSMNNVTAEGRFNRPIDPSKIPGARPRGNSAIYRVELGGSLPTALIRGEYFQLMGGKDVDLSLEESKRALEEIVGEVYPEIRIEYTRLLLACVSYGLADDFSADIAAIAGSGGGAACSEELKSLLESGLGITPNEVEFHNDLGNVLSFWTDYFNATINIGKKTNIRMVCKYSHRFGDVIYNLTRAEIKMLSNEVEKGR